MALPFLPTHVYHEARQNNMEGKAGRIVISWNRFARSVREACELYVETKQLEFNALFEEIPKKLKDIFIEVPIKKTLIALLPYMIYLLFYSNYNLIRRYTGLSEIRKPNISFLPWLEHLVFHCYPHRILSKFACPTLDVLAAIPYLIHFPLPGFFLLYLLLTAEKRNTVFRFAWCAGWVNMIALVVQYFFPTAPPWFVDSAVFTSDGRFIKAAPNEAGFHRLDALIGAHFFHGIYSASPLKFGAFPSLHVAWPAIILVNEPWLGKKFAWIHIVLITWAAMYSNHHYGIDAIAGIMLVFIVNFCILQIWSPFTNPNPQLAFRKFFRQRTGIRSIYNI